MVHRFLANEAPWSLGIPRSVFDRSLDNSLCASAFFGGRQVGFARVISDHATFAYADDVFVLSEHRRMGIASWLLSTLMRCEELGEVKSWWLMTDDQRARRTFERLGFTTPEEERLARWMALPGRSRGFWLSREHT
jgi:GNAT superfamily N-acetyltransferase